MAAASRRKIKNVRRSEAGASKSNAKKKSKHARRSTASSSLSVPLRRSSRIASIQTQKLSPSVKKDGKKGSEKRRGKAKPNSTFTTATGPTALLRIKELKLAKDGYQAIVGCDEAGRGPLAGPVVAAACRIPPDLDLEAANLEGIHDSKKLNKEAREKLFEVLTNHERVSWAKAVVSAETIDEINILQASMLAMHNAVVSLTDIAPDYVLIDGPRAPWGHEAAQRKDGSWRKADPPMPPSVKICEPVIKGDSKVLSIAAASIIAKVARDRIMDQLDEKYPGYGFSQHAGYPTRAHVAAVHKLGPCPEHRMTFAPLKHMKK